MYDAMKEIVKFNEISGNNRENRNLEDEGVLLQKNLIEEEMEELQESFFAGSEVDALDAAADLIVVTTGLIHKLGYDPNDVMKIVNDCNFSKFVETKVDADASIAAYENDERYEEVECEWTSFYDGGDQMKIVGVILGKKVGIGGEKILKGINTRKPEPELGDLIMKTKS